MIMYDTLTYAAIWNTVFTAPSKSTFAYLETYTKLAPKPHNTLIGIVMPKITMKIRFHSCVLSAIGRMHIKVKVA